MYEKLPKEEYERYHKEFQDMGVSIPIGSEVIATEWSYQNGVVKRHDRSKYTKIGNAKDGHTIYVLKEGNQQGRGYWAGFWKGK